MCAVLHRRIVMAIEMASKGAYFFIVVLLIVALLATGAIQRKVEVAWWHHPEASSVALVMLHWSMPRALLQCVCIVRQHHLFWLIKITSELHYCSKNYHGLLFATMDAILTTIVARRQAWF
jgi:hypothetical protein